MPIYTGSGDDGSSSLFGGQRVPKNHPRLDAYGTVDEAQSAIGMVRSSGELPEHIDALLDWIQKELFVVGADLATPDPEASIPRVSSTMISNLEGMCEDIEQKLPNLTTFVIPTGTYESTTCFWVRTIVRRAERCVAHLLSDEIRPATEHDLSAVLIYLNRLGDLLFLIAREINSAAGIEEQTWDGKN
jgi:cob(I)alamin adenosyltransferase